MTEMQTSPHNMTERHVTTQHDGRCTQHDKDTHTSPHNMTKTHTHHHTT